MAKAVTKIEEKLEKATGYVTVKRTVGGKKISENTEDEEISVHKFVTEPAKVTLNQGVTINLGNFENARIDVGISVPCYVEETDVAYTEASRWLEQRIVKEIDLLRDHARKRVDTNPYGER